MESVKTNLISLWVSRVVSCFNNILRLDLIRVFPSVEKHSQWCKVLYVLLQFLLQELLNHTY